MFGITSSGCFVIGIITGFIIAFILGVFCVFYFNPDIKAKALDRVEEYWGTVKTNVDSSIDAAKKAPTAEPAVPQSKAEKTPEKRISRKKTTPQAAEQKSSASQPRIELKLGL